MTRSEKLNVRLVINEKEGDDELKGIVLSTVWDKLTVIVIRSERSEESKETCTDLPDTTSSKSWIYPRGILVIKGSSCLLRIHNLILLVTTHSSQPQVKCRSTSRQTTSPLHPALFTTTDQYRICISHRTQPLNKTLRYSKFSTYASKWRSVHPAETHLNLEVVTQ